MKKRTRGGLPPPPPNRNSEGRFWSFTLVSPMKRKRWEKGNLEERRLVLCTTLELPTQEGRFGQYTCNNLALLYFFWKINPAYAIDTPMILKLCASSISVPFPTKFTQKTELKKFLKKKSRLLLQKKRVSAFLERARDSSKGYRHDKSE